MTDYLCATESVNTGGDVMRLGNVSALFVGRAPALLGRFRFKHLFAVFSRWMGSFPGKRCCCCSDAYLVHAEGGYLC